MEETEKKETRGISLAPSLWRWLSEAAAKENRNLSNFLETLVLEKKNG